MMTNTSESGQLSEALNLQVDPNSQLRYLQS